MERVLRITLESTWDRPNELTKHRIDILEDSKGRYFSKFKKYDDTGRIVAFKNELPRSKMAEILQLLPTIQVPAFPRHEMGCDGGFTEIEVGGYGGKSHFRWWSVPPKGWEALERIATEIVECSGF